MFAIGDLKWPGISKLVEECGEVLQLVGKLMGKRGEITHWNVANLKEALEDECGDLRAAIAFVTEKCGLDKDRIMKRAQEKLVLYHKWHQDDPEPQSVLRIVQRRGVDFPCEECGALEGSHVDDGWYRCNKCGYPSK